jgi:hypothetical protein
MGVLLVDRPIVTQQALKAGLPLTQQAIVMGAREFPTGEEVVFRCEALKL